MTRALPSTPAAPPPTPEPAGGLLASLAIAAADIKLAHTVFAMPFAVLGVFMARPDGERASSTLAKLALVVVCMVLARTWAMLFNRLADRRLDAANPRTARRAVASGRLGVAHAWMIAIASAALFWLAAAAFWPLFGNPWPAWLAPPVLAWIAFYSLTKRFTLLCHAVLGSALALSPLSAAIAVDPGAIGLGAAAGIGVPALYAIAAMVLCWVAGFDIIYALQDLEHDRSVGLRSVPAALGWRGATWCSRGAHALAVAALFVAWRLEPRFGGIFLSAATLVAALLALEHVVLARRGRRGLAMAFFTLNGVAGVVFATLAILDLVG